MKKIIIEVDKKDSEYLERLNFELGFAKDVLQRIIEAHPDDPTVIGSAAFTAYQKSGAGLEAEYKIASAHLEKKYIPENLKGHRYSWNLPFDSSPMEVTIYCDCEIEGVTYEKS